MFIHAILHNPPHYHSLLTQLPQSPTSLSHTHTGILHLISSQQNISDVVQNDSTLSRWEAALSSWVVWNSPSLPPDCSLFDFEGSVTFVCVCRDSFNPRSTEYCTSPEYQEVPVKVLCGTEDADFLVIILICLTLVDVGGQVANLSFVCPHFVLSESMQPCLRVYISLCGWVLHGWFSRQAGL